MHILGLNAFHGDASAALLSDGHLSAAVEEERFNRIKHWAGFPALAVLALATQAKHRPSLYAIFSTRQAQRIFSAKRLGISVATVHNLSGRVKLDHLPLGRYIGSSRPAKLSA